MTRRRDFRLLPILLIAVGGLAGLKIAGLLLDGGYTLLDGSQPQKLSWAQETLNYPVPGGRIEPPEVTGSVDAPNKPERTDEASEMRPAETVVTQPPRQVSQSERAVLERLQERRQELETRAREVDIRESLLKAAEKRIESKVDEMKDVESRISEATRRKEEADNARFSSIVIMYENMKPKDAGRIFDRLDMSVLIEVASRIKPQKMADILAQMSAQSAEKLTVEMARRSGGVGLSASAASLPKIEGKPSSGQ